MRGRAGQRVAGRGGGQAVELQPQVALAQLAGPGPADAAGHYAAHEATGVLVADIREFFRGLTG